jgi:hypothetical protein
MLQHIETAEIKNRSGFDVVFHPTIAPLREGCFRKMNWTIVGEAPKDFLRIYEHGGTNKRRSSEWPGFIAKVGQKWYPNESITEHFLTRLGQLLGMQIADSRLMWVRGQLRFLSRYFLKRDECLVHGAEIFAGYLADMSFVKEVEARKQSRDIFTFQVVEEAIQSRFPAQADALMKGFVHLLAFDAIVGNNDRHYFNWGVITHVSAARPPRFAPIFDTARALFWNTTEAKLEAIERQGQLESFMNRYVEDCQPKTGWDELPKINHFSLMREISSHRPALRRELLTFPLDEFLSQVSGLLEGEFYGLFSERRCRFVLSCLQKRIQKFKETVVLC